jgi:hypothetical protein
VHPVQDPKERRLPAAGGTDEGRDGARRHLERDAIQHVVVAEPGADVTCEQRGGLAERRERSLHRGQVDRGFDVHAHLIPLPDS